MSTDIKTTKFFKTKQRHTFSVAVIKKYKKATQKIVTLIGILVSKKKGAFRLMAQLPCLRGDWRPYRKELFLL